MTGEIQPISKERKENFIVKILCRVFIALFIMEAIYLGVFEFLGIALLKAALVTLFCLVSAIMLLYLQMKKEESK